MLYLDSNNRVGMGTNNPTQAAHVRRTDGTAQLLVEEANGTAAARTLLNLTNNGGVAIAFTDSRSSAEPWLIRTQNSNSELEIVKTGSGVKLTVKDTGDLEIDGDCIQVATNACTVSGGTLTCVTGTC